MMIKSRTLFFIVIGLLLLGVAVFTFSTRNQEPAQVFTATVNRDCAPWDGAAFTIRMPFQNGDVIAISIWKSPDFKFSKTFSFPDDTGQVGHASLLLGNGEYEALSGEVRFEGVSEGMPIEGRFRFTSERGGEYVGQFRAEWENQVSMCG